MRILYFDIDSLRPDHLGCYGYSRHTSPTIDRIAASGMTFDSCYVSDAPCMPSRTSLFSGRFGIRHGCVSHHGSCATPFNEGPARRFRSRWEEESWMNQLRKAGYRTATISSFGDRHGAFHWYAGFDEIQNTGGKGHELTDDVIPAARHWITRNASVKDWFLHVNFWDVHVPYRTPEAYGNPFQNEPLDDFWMSQELLDRHVQEPGIRSANDSLILHYARKRPDLNPASIRSLQDVKQIIDSYDTAIRYVDNAIESLLQELERCGIIDDTAIIIAADHGECLGELNAYGGHCFADAATTRVPMIIHWPGITDRKPGSRRSELIYHLDLAATVTEWAGVEPLSSWDAQSFAPLLTDQDTAHPGVRDHLVLSQLAQTCQRSVVFDSDSGNRWFYIRTFRSGFYHFPTEMLFDLNQDPHETDECATRHPEVVQEARQRLEQWRQEALDKSDQGDPLEIVLSEPPEPTVEKYRKRLEATGRAHLVETLTKR